MSESLAVSTDAITVTGAAGIFVIGDTILVRWDNSGTGDGNAGVTGVTVDFSDFGGGNVTATLEEGIWTASYLIEEGAAEYDDASVAVIATDGVEEAIGYSDPVSIDNQPPMLDASASSPVAGSLDIALDATVTLRFADAVTLGAGIIALVGGDGSREAFAAGDLTVIDDTDILLDLPGGLSRLTDYHIEIEAGAVLDAAGNPIAAVTDAEAYRFTTLDDSPLVTMAAGFDSGAGERIGGAATDGNDTILVADNGHVAGAVIDGGGGVNVLSLANGGTADLTAAESLVNIDVIRLLNGDGLDLTVSAGKGLAVGRIDGAGSADGLILSGADGERFDLSDIWLSGIERLELAAGGATMVLSEAQLCGCEIVSLQGGGSGILETAGPVIDLAGIAFDGFAALRITHETLALFNLDQDQIDSLDAIEASAADAEAVIVGSSDSLDLSGVALTHIDVVESVASGDGTITLTPGQIEGLSAIYGSLDAATTLSVDGDIDLSAVELDSIVAVRATSADGATITLTEEQLAGCGCGGGLGEIAGGAGQDTLRLAGAAGAGFDLTALTLSAVERVETAVDGAATVSLMADDVHLVGGDAGDVLGILGNGGLLQGGGGDDAITVIGSGNDAEGGTGADTIVAAGDGNRLFGGAGDDTLISDQGANLLDGGAGNDTLASGADADTLTGGAGADEFRGLAGDLAGDVISDFAVGDRIVVGDVDLSGFDGAPARASLILEEGEAALTLTGLSAGRGRFAVTYDADAEASTITLIAPNPPTPPEPPVIPPIENGDTPPVVGADGASVQTQSSVTQTDDGLTARIDQTLTSAEGVSATRRIDTVIVTETVAPDTVRETAISTILADGATVTLTRERTSVTETLDAATVRVTTRETTTGSDGSGDSGTIIVTTYAGLDADGRAIIRVTTEREDDSGIRLVEIVETLQSADGAASASRSISWLPSGDTLPDDQLVSVDLMAIENDLPDVPGLLNRAALQADIPAGYVLRSLGGGRETPQQATADLLERIEARTQDQTPARAAMTGDGDGFLAALPEQASLAVRTLIVEPPEGDPGLPVAVTIRGEAGDRDAARQEALVLDLTALPADSVVIVENVDFVAVIGPASVIVGSGTSYVTADGGDQRILLGGGDDTVNGGAGFDWLDLTGGGDNRVQGGMNGDTIQGGAGNEEIRGGKGHDSLEGGAGDDTIHSGFGDDTLAGGGGDDLFVLRAEDAALADAVLRRTILDFEAGSDRLAMPGVSPDDIAAAVAAQSPSEDGLILQLGGATIILVGVETVSQDDFLFM